MSKEGPKHISFMNCEAQKILLGKVIAQEHEASNHEVYDQHIDYTKKLFRRVNRKSVTGNTEQSQAAYSYHSLVDMNE